MRAILEKFTKLLLITCITLPAQFHTFPSKTYFREQWGRAPLAVEIEEATRLADVLFDGQLELPLRAYIELVMANSPDINLQKLSILEQKNSIQRAYSPFDPFVSVNLGVNRSTTPSADQLAGADIRTQLVHSGGTTFSQNLDTGTNYTIAYSGSRRADNSQFASFNPSLQQSLRFTLRQQLLRGRGRSIQRIPILIAESRLEFTREQVRERVIGLLFQAENDYWNAVNAREQLRVQENNLDISRAFLDQEKRRLELGAISPLDIFQPEQNFANAQVRVTQERYRFEQTKDAVRRWMGADLDPDFRNLPIVLTEPIQPAAYSDTIDAEETVLLALSRRPELEQSRRAIEISDLSIKGSNNGMRPNLALSANYSSSGIGGNFIDRSGLGGAAGEIVPGGFPEAFGQLFGFNFPSYGASLTLQLPLRNRSAAADLADAVIQKKRDLYILRGDEQAIRLEVLQAVAGVELSKAAVQQATVARGFAQKRLDAEQKKYELGVNTAFFVLQAQNDLVDAEAQVLTQAISYRRSRLTLLQATGELLEAHNITLR